MGQNVNKSLMMGTWEYTVCDVGSEREREVLGWGGGRERDRQPMEIGEDLGRNNINHWLTMCSLILCRCSIKETLKTLELRKLCLNTEGTDFPQNFHKGFKRLMTYP